MALAPACADDDDDPSARAGENLSAESSAFTVGHAPDGYVGVMAAKGTQRPAWGPDEDSGHEPFTVLSSDGTADGDEVVVVSFTGYERRQGGLEQASRWRSGIVQPKPVEIDGHDAYFVEAFMDEGRQRWSDLVVDQGNDLAVRITSIDGTLDELRAVLPSVVIPTSHDHAPEIVDPPRGLEVVGSADIDAVVALDPWVDPERRYVPGPRGSRSASWEGSDGFRDQVVVMTIPGRWVDLDVLRYAPSGESFIREEREIEVGDEPAVLLETPRLDGSPHARAIVWVAPWGDVVLAHSEGLDGPLSVEALSAIAESVERADEPAWARFADDLDGGPGFRADLSRKEVTRGTIEGLEWLLQTSDPEIARDFGEGLEVGVDGCLKFSDGSRRCGQGGTWSGADSVQPNLESDPPFLILTTDRPAHALQVVGADGVPLGDPSELVPVPGGGMSAGVVFLPTGNNIGCEVPVDDGEYSVRVLAEHGRDLGCADFGREGAFFGGI